MEQQKALKWWKELPFTKIEGFRTEYEDVIDGMLLDDQIQFIYENEMAKEWWINKTSDERLLLIAKYGFSDGGQSQILSIYRAKHQPANPDSPGEVKQAVEEINVDSTEFMKIGDDVLSELKKNDSFIFHQLQKHNERISFNTGFHRGFVEGGRYLSTALAKANAEKEEVRELLQAIHGSFKPMHNYTKMSNIQFDAFNDVVELLSKTERFGNKSVKF